MAELDRDPTWHRFNHYRGSTRAPGGELMLEAQARMLAELERIHESHPDGVVAVFSHSDISVIELGDAGPRILKLNETS